MWIWNLKRNGLGNTKPSLHWQHPLKTLNTFFYHCFTRYISMVEQAGHFLYLQCKNLKHKYDCNVRSRNGKNAGLWTWDVDALAWNPGVTVVFTATMYFTRGALRMTGVWVTEMAFSATLPVGQPSPGYVQDLRETDPVTFPTVIHIEFLLAICPRWRGMTAKAVHAEGYSGWKIQAPCYVIHEQCFRTSCMRQTNKLVHG